MRIRATAAAVTVSGALALTAFAVPAAQADDSASAAKRAQALVSDAAAAQQHNGARALTRSAADDGEGDTAISNVVVNGGKDLVAGTSATLKFAVTFTVKDNSGVLSAQAFLWKGSALDENALGWFPLEDEASCKVVNATTSTCTQHFQASPKTELYNGLEGGNWHVWALAQGNDYDYATKDNYKTVGLKRYSKLTTNAAPEPVKKGKTITVSGLLSRANWDTGKYAGYTKQKVTLQYRKKTSSTYSNVKTVTSSSTGALKTTVTASADGYFRYKFAGTSTTPAVTSVSDFVDVR
ncbi:DUF5707 domain-containing protein [Streptomyces sp. NPDC050264]|uniref:DUF5707 domain-containing protein n=1 Tax=Streptomyces sp. NPDC050264 TaxID=3155038 RepID=UPI003438A201